LDDKLVRAQQILLLRIREPLPEGIVLQLVKHGFLRKFYLLRPLCQGITQPLPDLLQERRHRIGIIKQAPPL
jgi:hypothetical protein